MKLKISSILFLIVIILAGCKKDDDANPEPEIKISIVPLLTEDNIEVGTVSVWQDNNKLHVKYSTRLGLSIKETYLHVWKPNGYQWGDYFNGFPFSGETKDPDIDRFAYKGKHDSKMTFEYEISISDDPKLGVIAIAAHAVVTSGMDVLESFAHLLPKTGTVKILWEYLGAPAYFPEVSVSNTDGFLDGKYLGWCAEADVAISQNKLFDAYVFSSLEDLTGKNVLKYPENINKVNWILNQRFIGKDSQAGGIFTYGDVQYAIWDLISILPPISGSAHNMDRVNEIVHLAQDHSDFIPEYGGIFAIIFKIENAQNILIEYPVPYYEKESVWGKGEYFNEQEKRAMHFKYELP